MNFEKIPIWYFNCNGNTFLIFDTMSSESNTLDWQKFYEYIKNYHKKYGYSKIDTCMILKKTFSNKEKLVISIYFIEKNFQGEADSFCGNGSRAISYYLHKEYLQYKKYYLKHNGLYLPLIQDGPNFGVGLLKNAFDDTKKIFCLAPAFPFHEQTYNINLFFTYSLEPHLVTFAKLSIKELHTLGCHMQKNYKNIFPRLIHINTVSINYDHSISVRTFEAGAMKVTGSCGSGSIAAVHTIKKLNLLSSQAHWQIKNKQNSHLTIKEDSAYYFLFGEIQALRIL